VHLQRKNHGVLFGQNVLLCIALCDFWAEEQAALYKRKAIIRQQTDEEQINADLNVLRIKKEAVDADSMNSLLTDYFS
jgi:hypothetical protein